jgi:hypothetical protein
MAKWRFHDDHLLSKFVTYFWGFSSPRSPHAHHHGCQGAAAPCDRRLILRGIAVTESISYEIAHLSPRFTSMRSRLFVTERSAADLPCVGISAMGPRAGATVGKHYWRFGLGLDRPAAEPHSDSPDS